MMGLTLRMLTLKWEITEQIHIKDCTVVSVMNAFKIGTETYFLILRT